MTIKAYPKEREVKTLVETSLGLQCDIELGAPKKEEFIESAEDAKREIEIDFLIPFRDMCIIGEHTDERSRKSVKTHLQKLAAKIDFLRSIPAEDRFGAFDIPRKRLAAYAKVEQLSGCLIYSNTVHDRPIQSTHPSTIVTMSHREWEQVNHYAACLGQEGKYHFLDAVGVPLGTIVAHHESGKPKSMLAIEKGEYLSLGSRTLVKDFPKADVFVFTLDPNSLLPLSRVLRRDSLPALVDPSNPDSSTKYQRILIKKKLEDLRNLINSVGSTFAFPTAVLALMSDSTRVDSTDSSLVLPKQFGTLEVIDGQHRLFAYATKSISKSIRDESQLIVVGVRFDTNSGGQGQKWAARMFVDINTKQTRVQRDLQLIIAYESGQQEPECLATGMLLKSNESGPLENRFYVGATSPTDSIKITTIITRLKPLFDLKKIRKLPTRELTKRVRLLKSDKSIFEDGREADYVAEMAICYRTFFIKVSKKFGEDWGDKKDSSLLSAKYFAAFTERLKHFVERGNTWEQVDRWLDRLRKRSLKKSSKPFRERGIAFGCEKVPTRKSSLKEIIDHLK